MDGPLAALNRRLSETHILYGDDSVRREYARKARAGIEAPASTAADRGRFFAGAGGKMAKDDILGDLAEGKIAVGALPAEKLPEPMRAMTEPERTAHVAKLDADRKAIVSEIKALSSQRDKYLREDAKKKGTSSAAPSLDSAIEGTITKQGEAFGIKY
jgi:hypothetical protein